MSEQCPHHVYLLIARCPVCDEKRIAELEKVAESALKLCRSMNVIGIKTNRTDAVLREAGYLKEKGDD